MTKNENIGSKEASVLGDTHAAIDSLSTNFTDVRQGRQTRLEVRL